MTNYDGGNNKLVMELIISQHPRPLASLVMYSIKNLLAITI